MMMMMMMMMIVQIFQPIAQEVGLNCLNQDLVGFFTSILVERILQAVDWMLRQSMLKYNIDSTVCSFSVSPKEKDSKLRMWKGKARSAGQRYVSSLIQRHLGNCSDFLRFELLYGNGSCVCTTK